MSPGADPADPDEDDTAAVPVAPIHHDLQVGGGSAVHVRVWPGRPTQDGGRRPALLALHGWTDSGAVFGPLARALGHRWTVVAPDAPGHGRTTWTRSPRYTITEQVGPVLAVLAALPELTGRPQDVVLLGHSMGALTAARALAESPTPGTVSHLVMEDPAATSLRRLATSTSTRAWVHPLRGLTRDELLAHSRADHAGWHDDEHEPWVDSKLSLDLATIAVPTVWGPPLVAALAEVECPVTLIRGRTERGGIVALATARRLAKACRGGADVVTLEAGHNVRREARDPFLAVLAAVLGRHER